MMLFLLSLYVFLIPIEASGIPAFHLGGIRVSVIQLFEVLLLFLVLIRIAQAKWFYLDNAIKLMLGILLLWGAESMIHLFWFDINVYGYDFKRPLNFAEYAVIIFIFLNIVDDMEKARKICFVYLASASVILVLTYGKSLGLNIPGIERNTVFFIGPFKYGVVAIFNNAEGHAAWTLPLIPVLISSILSGYPLRFNRLVLSAALLLTIFGVALNGSRGTLVACGGSVITTLFLI